MIEDKNKSMRVFEQGYANWQGNNILLCKGRVIGGPEKCKMLRTFLFILIPTLVFLIFPLRITFFFEKRECKNEKVKQQNKTRNKKKTTNTCTKRGRQWWVTQNEWKPIVMCLSVLLLTYISFFITAFRDPGIIPRVAAYGKSNESFGALTQNRMPPKKQQTPYIQNIYIGGRHIIMKYCRECILFIFVFYLQCIYFFYFFLFLHNHNITLQT